MQFFPTPVKYLSAGCARAGIRGVALAVCLVVGASPAASACLDMRDDFESGVLEPANWLPKQLYNNQLAITREAPDAPNTVAGLYLKPGDRACAGGCQRNEIRVANDKRCAFGQEVWYRFRFRIVGDAPQTGSIRWVIGQWKQESGGSPFLAQRFDNGVFHITVQRNDNRILVTKAPGNPNARRGAADQVGFMAHQQRIRRAALGRVDPAPLNDAIDRGQHEVLVFRDRPLSGAETDVTVELAADPVLPDPRRDWVEMIYRVRGGVEGTGLVEIWADGVFKARVRGTLGNDGSAGPTQYFKFGLYRDIHESFGTDHFFFDDFRRSTDRAAVFD